MNIAAIFYHMKIIPGQARLPNWVGVALFGTWLRHEAPGTPGDDCLIGPYVLSTDFTRLDFTDPQPKWRVDTSWQVQTPHSPHNDTYVSSTLLNYV